MMPKNRITPVILCNMEEIAVIGSFIVLRSRFTGRWLFTAYSHLESPKLQGELSGRHLQRSTRHHRSDDRQLIGKSHCRSATEYSAKNTIKTTPKHSPKCALPGFDKRRKYLYVKNLSREKPSTSYGPKQGIIKYSTN